MTARDPDGAFAALLAEIQQAPIFGCDPALVELRQTHASAVFLTPSEVFKLKKPVNLGFLDYSTRRRRALMARREVDLNRRLAPGVYLGVRRLVRTPGGSLALDAPGETLDYLVHMRRLPDEASLAAHLAAGLVSEEEVRRVARLIATFHATAALAPARYGSPALLARNARENVAVLRSPLGAGLSRPLVERLETSFAAFLRDNRDVLVARVRAGRIRDGHGDLRAEHVYFDGNEIQVIDCIEFASRFRCGDVALDLAFLAMDLAASGHQRLAGALVEEYSRAAGDDVAGVMPYFMAYRASVRSKVAVVRASSPGFSDSERAAAVIEAARYLYAAVRMAEGRDAPQLIVVCGLTGSGKSTVARLLARVLPAKPVSADETRKRLAGLGAHEHPRAAIDEGIYDPRMSRAVYAALRDHAAGRIRGGGWALIDATFLRRAERDAVRDLAAALGVRCLIVECTAPETVVHERLERRVRSGGDPWSDGTWETYQSQLAKGEPLSADEREGVLTVDTTNDDLVLVNAVLERLAGPG